MTLKHNVNLVTPEFKLPQQMTVINFMTDWHEPCLHMNLVFEELSRTFPSILYFQADAEVYEELGDSFDIEQVPTFVMVNNGLKVDQVVGANPLELKEMLAKYASMKQPLISTLPVAEELLNDKLRKLVNSQPVMIFIKGTPAAPQCGFSRQLIEILDKEDCAYGSFNILEEEQVRQGLKEFSNWPTFPQVYIQGELVGGLDIVKEMVQDGEFQKMLPNLNARLIHLINKAPVMLFMKGNPSTPKCGFSRVLVGILNDHNVKYDT